LAVFVSAGVKNHLIAQLTMITSKNIGADNFHGKTNMRIGVDVGGSGSEVKLLGHEAIIAVFSLCYTNLMINFDQTRLIKVCQENNISFLGVFGSVARGDYRSDSDVDLLARFDKQKSLFDLVVIENQLEEVFQRKVDLLTEGAISPYLKDYIKTDLQQLYAH